MRKSLKIIVACSTVIILFVGCQNKNEDKNVSMLVNKSITNASLKVSDNYKLIGEIQEKNIQLLGKENVEGGYDKFILKNNEEQKVFNWESTWKQPDLVLNDFNSDGIEELLVVLTTGYGTGLLKQEIHVINLSKMSEFKIADPVDIAKDSIKASLSSNKIIFTLNNKEFSTEIKNKSVSNGNINNLIYGTSTRYYVKDNGIKAKIDAKINPSDTLAEFEISYKFEDEKFLLDNLSLINTNE